MKPSAAKRFFKAIEGYFVRRKQQRIVRLLLDKCDGRELVARYAAQPADNWQPIGETSPLWVCWWQGEADMPPIARACLHSLRMQAGRHPVTLITKANFREFVDFPDYILRKLSEGNISLTHFSDLLRVSLLSRYGGIWADATLLLPGPAVDSFIRPDATFWSCHHRPIYHNISRGGWVGFFWACGKGHPLPSFIRDLLFKYWDTYDRLVEYLLIDYCFAIARAHIPAIHDMIEALPLTTMGPLGKRLAEPYDPQEWEAYRRDFDFHKLSYKARLRLTTPKGRPTNYAHILETWLPADGGRRPASENPD